MRNLSASLRLLFLSALILPSSSLLKAQSSLTLASATAAPGATVALGLSLSSTASNLPAAVQWTLGYSTAAISNVTVTAGPALTAAGKTVTCAGSAGAYACIAYGVNAATIANGVVATVSATLAGSTGATITVTNGVAASPAGDAIATTTTGGTIAVSVPAVTVSSLGCSPATLGPGGASACTVTLSGSTGATVTLASSSTNLTVPASVAVSSGATTATFTATAKQFTADENPTVTASLNGSSKTTFLVLSAPPKVSSLQCAAGALTGNASATCTVTLNKTATAASTVTLTNTNTALTVPPSATVAASASSATFNVSTGAISTSGSAAITATLNGGSATFTITLTPSVAPASVSCTPSSVAPGGTASCTVTLNKAASTSSTVQLASNNANLTVPGTLTIAAGATTGPFTASAGAFTSDQTATLTATLNGSATTNVGLVLSATVSSVSCNPATLAPNGSAACTVSLTKPAPAGGAAIVISTVNSVLSAPSPLTIPYASSSGSFTLTAKSFTANQSGSVSAAYNGTTKSAAISLVAPVLVSALACSPSGVMSGAASTCTVTLSQPPASATTVTLGSNSPLAAVPSSVSVPAGSGSANFNVSAGALTADSTATITATLGTSSKSAALTLWSIPTLSSITCAASKVTVGSPLSCTVTMSKPAAALAVALTSNNAALTVPPSVTVPMASSSASFLASASSFTTAWIVISATYNGVSKGVVLTTATAPLNSTATALHEIVCTPKSMTAGSSGVCRLTLDQPDPSASAEVRLTSSSDALKLPAGIVTRPGQSVVEFQIDAEEAASPDSPVAVSAELNSGIVQDTVTLAPDPSLLRLPASQFVRYGTELRFRVRGSDPAVALSTGLLPDGAAFDAAAGEFVWTPSPAQAGSYQLEFAAADSAGRRSSGRVAVQVESGEPVVTGVVNAAARSRDLACSPGAIAAIQGRWLTGGDAASDPSGASQELLGTRVRIDGIPAVLVAAAPAELTFVCPNAVPGSEVAIVVETGRGAAAPVRATIHAAAPGLFSMDGSGQGQGSVVLANSSKVAMLRNYRSDAQPAAPGDRIAIYATGVDGMTHVAVHIGSLQAAPAAIYPVPNRPGIFCVEIPLPGEAPAGNEVRLYLTGDTAEGITVTTNFVSIAVEHARR